MTMQIEDKGQRRALVTGAAGFIGSHLVRRLLEDGWSVTAITHQSNPPGDVDVIRDDGSLGDLTEAVLGAAPDVCFHLATHFVASHQPSDLDAMIEANLRFGLRVIESMSQRPSASFVNVGTIWQHHDSRPYGPVSLYAAMKQAFQDIVQFYAESTPMKTVTLELPDSYGPGDRRQKLVSILLHSAQSGQVLDMSGGEQYYDVLFVADVVSGLLEAPRYASENAPVFSLHSPSPTTVRSFVEEVERHLGQSIPIQWGARPYRSREMMAPWLTTPLLPGWRPRVQLADGLQHMRDEDD